MQNLLMFKWKGCTCSAYFTSHRLINVSTEQESILFGSDGDQLTSLKKKILQDYTNKWCTILIKAIQYQLFSECLNVIRYSDIKVSETKRNEIH